MLDCLKSLHAYLTSLPLNGAGITNVVLDGERFRCDLELRHGSRPFEAATLRTLASDSYTILSTVLCQSHSSSIVSDRQRLYGLMSTDPAIHAARLAELDKAAALDAEQLGVRLELIHIHQGQLTWQPRGKVLHALLRESWQERVQQAGFTILPECHDTLAACSHWQRQAAGPVAQWCQADGAWHDLMTLPVSAKDLETPVRLAMAMIRADCAAMGLQPLTMRLALSHPGQLAGSMALANAAGASVDELEVDGIRHDAGLHLYASNRLGRESRVGSLLQPNAACLQVQLFGSVEQRIGCLLEHGEGHLPGWLAPLQIAILPVAPRHEAAAAELAVELRSERLRHEVWTARERLGRRLRDVHRLAIPYAIFIGDADLTANTITLRQTRHGAQSSVLRSAVTRQLEKELSSPLFSAKK